MAGLREHILEKGLVAEDDLTALEAWAPYKGARLAERIYRSGLLSEQQLVEAFLALGATDGTADLVGKVLPPAALGALNKALAERHRAIGLVVARSRLVVAMLDPSDTEAIERISFFSGLVVEPRAVRARVLFQALADAYGIAPVVPDAAFLASRRDPGFAPPPHSDHGEDDKLPAPSPDAPVLMFGQAPRAADPSVSPLARSVMAATGGVDPLVIDVDGPRTPLALELLRDTRPSHTPSLPEAALERLRKQLPLGSPLEARDSLPPQVLRFLVPPLRTAVLFLVRGSVAVGWDGRTPTHGRDAIRDVLLPLTAPSTFQRALQWQRVSVGNAADPATVERILWRHLGLPAPSSLAVVPILVGADVHALLYVDRDEGMLDDTLIDQARRVGTTLADGIAPFVANGTLFPSVRHDKLKPIKADVDA